jgi:hypothetical protein
MEGNTNTGGETLANSINNELEKPLDEIIPSVKADKITQNEQTKNMETHANHLHKAPGNKFWHFFFEFLMLFLAVFCGFLAENLREHQVEKDREKQFMQSLVGDLKADIASITDLNQVRNARHRMYDSLSWSLSQKRYTENGAVFYFWGRSISRRIHFFSSDGTMQQLKNSGGLRLISNKSIANKIIAYDVLYTRVLHQQELEEAQLLSYRALAGKIFDAAVFHKMAILNDSIAFERPEGNPQLKDNSPALLNEMANTLNYWVVGSTLLHQLLEELNEKAVSLIELIQKEYHLE